MHVEFYNVSTGRAHYVVDIGNGLQLMSDDSLQIEALKPFEVGSKNILSQVGTLLSTQNEQEEGIYQVRLFTADPESPVLTQRFETRAIYFADWDRASKAYNFTHVK